MQRSDPCAALLRALERVLAACEPTQPTARARTMRAARTALAACSLQPAAHDSTLPVLRWITHLTEDGDRTCLAAFVRSAPRLEWRQTYGTAEVGEEFLANYAFSELLGPRGPRAGRAAPGIACGLLLLGAHTLYPPHHHTAQEIYIPLAGAADWRRSAGPWTRRCPGEVIHHRSEEPHAMRTQADPLLALYLWYGEQLAASAHLSAGVA